MQSPKILLRGNSAAEKSSKVNPQAEDKADCRKKNKNPDKRCEPFRKKVGIGLQGDGGLLHRRAGKKQGFNIAFQEERFSRVRWVVLNRSDQSTQITHEFKGLILGIKAPDELSNIFCATDKIGIVQFSPNLF